MNMDLLTQGVLYAFTLLCVILSFWWPMFNMGHFLVMPLAFFQLMSGLYYGVGKQSKWHRRYLTIAVLYSAFVPVTLFVVSLFLGPFWFSGYLVLFIFPMFIASVYLYTSWRYHFPPAPKPPMLPKGDPMLLDDWSC